MTLLLPNILASPLQTSYLLLQSSTTQSCLPILRRIIANRLRREKGRVILLLSLYKTTDLVLDDELRLSERLDVVDWTPYILGYLQISWEEREDEVKKALERAPSSQPITFVLDSVDTLFEDFGSKSKTYRFLRNTVLKALQAKGKDNQLILHTTPLTPFLPLLKQVSFSPSLTQLTAHPPALLAHIASAYLTPPPPLASPPEKFWRIFLPLSARTYDVEDLIFGPNGPGGAGGSPSDEVVVEVLVRGRSASGGAAQRKQGVERALEGWSDAKGGACALADLASMSAIMQEKKHFVEVETPDPTHNVSFNLNLTESQQAARSKVPLPYEHEGKVLEAQQGHIYYDPDSADDLDEEDPDEDLDI